MKNKYHIEGDTCYISASYKEQEFKILVDVEDAAKAVKEARERLLPFSTD